MSANFLKIKEQLPTLGIGLGLRRDMAEDTFNNAGRIDWLEIAPENYMGIGGRAHDLIEQAREHFPVISHGLNLSIGSTDDLNRDYLKELKAVLDLVDAPWWSDHLCFASVEGAYMHDLLPLPFTREAVRHISERIKIVQDYIERPFLFENISFYMYAPASEMTEVQFISEIAEEADCGLLLDVNNVYVNATNHKFDARQFIDQLPIDRTVQIHVAGHKKMREVIIDTHGSPVIEPVYELLEYVLERTAVKGVMIERDQNFPEFEEILGELDVLRAIAGRAQSTLIETGRSSKEAHVRPVSA